MKHTIIGYKKYPKSTLYYLLADDPMQNCDVGKSTASVFVPLTQHTPTDEDIGASVNLSLRKFEGNWISKITFGKGENK